ncbi:MAG: restriction endonuclease [Candidatus Bathyarchaeota archaeon]|nr:restriction endonuclease [Candidatus Bathyarchaeota archaeon]MDH5531901.1 restriction endonuclease [Candidatus Bathyarchaeota archaeon]MDH5712632.1 restriction endonuclease [Candidatus Bathyarchaeota archaeon]
MKSNVIIRLNVFGVLVVRGGNKVSGEEFVKKAEVISAVRDYENRRTRRKGRIVDFTVSPSESDDKILIRVITEGKSKSGYVGVDTVREMNDILEKRNYDKGILIGKRFTEAAKSEMVSENIEAISERITPHFKLERLYSAIDSCVRNLCRAKCGRVPIKESDCKGYVDSHYSCDVRLTSDNASFHLEQGWIGFLERDLAKLLAIEKP